MEENTGSEYVKRTQKDYSMSFKLQVVQEVEHGELSCPMARRKYGIQGKHTVEEWLKKYGTFAWESKSPFLMEKTPQQRILELEQQVKLLKKQNAFLEKRVENADTKSVIFDMMIDLAEKEYKIPIRKNSLPGQSNDIVANSTDQ